MTTCQSKALICFLLFGVIHHGYCQTGGGPPSGGGRPGGHSGGPPEHVNPGSAECEGEGDERTCGFSPETSNEFVVGGRILGRSGRVMFFRSTSDESASDRIVFTIDEARERNVFNEEIASSGNQNARHALDNVAQKTFVTSGFSRTRVTEDGPWATRLDMNVTVGSIFGALIGEYTFRV